MSGGSFNYAYSKVEQFVDALEEKMQDFKAQDIEDYSFDEETNVELVKISQELRHSARLMKLIEWLYSGDILPESFKRELMEIELERMVKS